MNIHTPLRVLRALREPDGARRYRSALRDRAWRGLAALPFGVTLNAKLGGSLQIRINSRDSVISRSIFVTGEWEPAELNFIRGYVKPGMTCVDVGANIGAHTLTMAKCAGPDGRVHSFEPTRVFETLSYNVRQNGFASRAILNNCAAGEKDGTIRLLTCKPGLELFTSRETPLVPEASTGEYAEYPLTTLDTYARKKNIDHIDFLKVDVEGAEELVFRGASGLFARKAIGCIMFELNEVCMTDVGDSVSSLIDLIRSSGYHMATFDAAGSFQPLPESIRGVFNVVAVREPELISGQHRMAYASSLE